MVRDRIPPAENYEQKSFFFVRGHPDIVRLLMEKGADVNATNDTGITALMCGAQKGYHDIVKILLEDGADINLAGQGGSTALGLAENSGHKAIVDLLEEDGAKK